MQLRIFTEPQQGATYDQLLAVARATEDGGFDGFFRSDHYMAIWGDGLPWPTDAWATFAGLARETQQDPSRHAGHPVTFRPPGALAIIVAQVDAMSGGRVELGLGTGWYEAEHEAHGIPFPPFGERFQRLEEQVDIVLGLWTTPPGERFSYAGRHHTLTDSPALPKPVQSPHPPLIIGGVGPRRTPELAARRAAAIGQDPAGLRTTGVAGTPAECVERLGAYADAGVSRIYLQVLDLSDLGHLELLAAEVLPQIRSVHAPS